jgi:hypothetical protein
LNQGVKTTDSPTFADVTITGDANVLGNLFVEGNANILDTNIFQFEDNILLINTLETGEGVTLNQAGWEVKRGTLENYRIVFNEPDLTFKAGPISGLQTLTYREDSPLNNGIAVWNNSLGRLDFTHDLSSSITFSSTKESLNATTGSVVINGGLGVKKNLSLNGDINLSTHGKISIYNGMFNISSNNVNISSSNVIIPYNTPITFGENTQTLKTDSVTKNIILNTSSDIELIADNVILERQSSIIFSNHTHTEKIYADENDNIVITGSKDIHLRPGTNGGTDGNKKIPADSSLIFANKQSITSNTMNT